MILFCAYLAAPASADPVGAVNEDEGQHGHIELWLDGQPVIVEVVQEGVVVRMEHGSSRLLKRGEDVTGARRVLKQTPDSPTWSLIRKHLTNQQW